MKLFFIIFLSISLLGCEALIKANQRPHIDVKLIGIWEGEYIEKNGTLKKWVQTRKADGSYQINFSFTEIDGTINSFSESGKWWIKDGLFHELEPSWMKEADIYQYQFKSQDCIHFELVSGNDLTKDIDDDYTFSECLVKDAPLVHLRLDI